MGTKVIFVVDTNGVDYRAAAPGSPELKDVAEAYGRCVEKCGVQTLPAEVRPFHLTELRMIELDGPWQSAVWIWPRAWTIGTSQKWGVFLTDAEEMVTLLREAICLGQAVNCRQLVGFPNQGRGEGAAELALFGVSVPDLIAKLQEDGLARIELSARRDASIESIATKLGENAEALEEGFFVVNLVDLSVV